MLLLLFKSVCFITPRNPASMGSFLMYQAHSLSRSYVSFKTYCFYYFSFSLVINSVCFCFTYLSADLSIAKQWTPSPISLGELLLIQSKIIIITFVECLVRNRQMLSSFPVSTYFMFIALCEVSTTIISIYRHYRN